MLYYKKRMKDETQQLDRTFFMPIIKSESGKIQAILSDDSIDHDGEIAARKFLAKFVEGDKYLPGLMDHKNTVLSNVAEWVNKRIEKVAGHYALVAEPRWFESNPNAQIVKNMIEKDGAQMGVSIGAIITEWDDTEIDGKSYRTFTDGKILEASFTPVPANSHARVMAIAKSLNKNKEVSTMADNDNSEQTTEETVPNETVPNETVPEGAQKSVSVSDKKFDDLVQKSAEKLAEGMIEKRMKDVDKMVDTKVEKQMSDRFKNLEAMKRVDTENVNDSATKVDKKLDISKMEPTPENFIAVSKGWTPNRGE